MSKLILARMSLVVLFLFFSFDGIGQRVIKGRIVNEATGIPVPGASVFINNTSNGTISDNTGHFQLDEVPMGKHELVISSIGYETNIFSFTDAQLPLQLKVELHIKVKELENVIIEPSVEEGWDKWGGTFLDNFIGTTENASRCKIKNQGIIKFRYYKKSNRLIAYADEPLQIENKALGYLIKYQLEDFEVNFKERTSVFLGYSLFGELSKDKKAWQRRRQKAYEGSMMHFFRSLYEDNLKDAGFEIRRMVKFPNEEKARIKSIYKPIQTINSNNSTVTKTIEIKQPDLSADSINYYQRIMHQDDYVEVYGKDLLSADNLIIKEDGVYKLLYFDDYLFVTYTREREEEGYVRLHNEKGKTPYQRSFLFLPEKKPVWIEANGNYYNPKDLFALGYWGWSEKMADNLPMDYKPEK